MRCNPRSILRWSGAAALLAGTGLLALGLAAPANAVDSHNSRCQTITHGDTKGFTTAGAATATLTGDGVLLRTGTTSDNDRVDWKYTFTTAVDADTVTRAGYTTTKLDTAGTNVNDAALTAYRIFVRINGHDGVLIYEPYWNTVGNPPRNTETTWDVLAGKLWTSSTTIPGLAKTAGGPPEKTFAQVRADNPDMLVTAVGLGLGTYNRGTRSLTNDVRFQASGQCFTHEWSTRFTKPTPTAGATSTTTPTATATATTTATATVTQTPVGNPGGCNVNYPQLCLTHDVNCADLTARNFTVLPADPYGLDGPKGPRTSGRAGIGCEDSGKPTPYLPGTPTPTPTITTTTTATPTATATATATMTAEPTTAAPTTSPAAPTTGLAVTPLDYSGSQIGTTVTVGLTLIAAAGLLLFLGRRRSS